MLRQLFSTEGVNPKHYRVFLVVNYIAYLAFAVHTSFIPLFLWLDVAPLAYFNILSSAAWTTVYFLNRRGRIRLAIVIGVGEVVAHAVLSVYYLGWTSGFHYYLLPVVPFLYFNARQSTPGIVIESLLVFTLYVYMYIHFQQPPIGYSIDAQMEAVLRFSNVAINFTALAILGYYYRVASYEAEQKMRLLATTDPLTGLNNRRRILDLLEEEKNRLARDPTPACVALTDIDHFKRFNDTWGHDCGDEVLKEVGAILKRHMLTGEAVARWGGEEFILLLADSDLDAAGCRVDKIRQEIADRTFTYQDNDLQVTMTFGIATLGAEDSIDGCIKRADDALYQGKEAGRNRVVAA